MSTKDPSFFDAHTEPIPSRIAAGLNKIGLAMKHQAWQQANKDGLSPTQGQILAALVGQSARDGEWSQASAQLSGKELSERLGVSLPTISDSVRVLVEKGLVTKSPDPRHPRATLIAPTERGAELGARARSWPEFMADAVGELSAEEQRAFLSGVVKMVRSLQEHGLVPLSGMCATCTYFRPNVHTGEKPHHCALIDAPLATDQLRLDCPEHVLAAEATRREIWQQFLGI